MSFRKYIIRNGRDDAWLTNIYEHNDERICTFKPDPAEALVYETLHEARKVAALARGRVQVLKCGADGKLYGEDA